MSFQKKIINKMKKIISILLVLIFTQNFLLAAEPVSAKQEEDIIKKSTSGICHDKKSKFYEKTKKFKPFKTMKECLDSGGRLPKK
jgi:hypothetical protein